MSWLGHLADFGPLPLREFVAGTGRKDSQDRFSGWAFGHGAVMHHTQMTDRLTRRTIDRNGQITFYPIFLEPGILGKNLLQVGRVIGEAIGENVLAGWCVRCRIRIASCNLSRPRGQAGRPGF